MFCTLIGSIKSTDPVIWFDIFWTAGSGRHNVASGVLAVELTLKGIA